LRGKTHSSHGGRKAHLSFELKDAPKARGLRPSQILDFKVQIRSGLPCDEWEDVAGTARCRPGIRAALKAGLAILGLCSPKKGARQDAT